MKNVHPSKSSTKGHKFEEELKQEENKQDHYDRDEKAHADYIENKNADSHYDQDEALIDDSEE